MSNSITKLHNIALEIYNSRTSRRFSEDFTKDELITLWTEYCIFTKDKEGNFIPPKTPYDDEVYDALDKLGYWDERVAEMITVEPYLSLAQYTEYIQSKMDAEGYYTEITKEGGVLFSLTNKVRGLEGMYAEVTRDELIFHLDEMEDWEKTEILEEIK